MYRSRCLLNKFKNHFKYHRQQLYTKGLINYFIYYSRNTWAYSKRFSINIVTINTNIKNYILDYSKAPIL